MWQENETSIVLKMLDNSLRSKDRSRLTELQRSLLDIERKPEKTPAEEELAPLPSAEVPFTLGPPAQEPSRNSGSTAETSFSPAEQEYLEKAIKQNVKQYDAQINIVIVGNGFTGKTSVTTAIVGSKFELNTPRSTGYILGGYYLLRIDWTQRSHTENTTGRRCGTS